MPRYRRFATLGVALAASAAGLIVSSGPASADVTTFTVTTTADTDPSAGPCGDTSIVTAPDPLSLRDAACLADNVGGAVTINLPAGEYPLENGTLNLEHHTGQTVTLAGVGSDNTTLQGNNAGSVIQTDAGGSGGNSTVLTGLTLFGGYANATGGAGIRNGTGSVSTNQPNSLSLTGVTLIRGYSDGSGAGIESTNSSLSIADSKFEDNLSYGGNGGGLDFHGNGSLGENLTIDGTWFDDNAISPLGNGGSPIAGGALNIDGNSPTVTITDSRFTQNTVQSRDVVSYGGAVRQHSGALTVLRSTFEGNQTYGQAADRGGAIYVDGDSSATTVTHSFISYNYELPNSSDTNPSGIVNDGAAVVDATENWWGCNAGPGHPDCDAVTGSITTDPHLTFSATASPQHVVGPNGTATINASLLTDSAGNAVNPSQLTAFDGQSLRISAVTGGGTATSGDPQYPYDASFSHGVSSISYDSKSATGAGSVAVTFGQETATAQFEVGTPAVFTSADKAGLRIGKAGALQITTGGGHQFPGMSSPTTVTESGALPTGVQFADNGDGTATLSGIPQGRAAAYPVQLSVDNGVGAATTQAFTLYATTGAPTVTARATTPHGRTHYLWFRDPVTVHFRCSTHGAPLTKSCPATTVLTREGAGQSVTRTIHAADGETATTSMRGIAIDRTAPTVRLTGYRNGATYYGKLPQAHCVGHDAVSGVIACSIYRHRSGHTVQYTVIATDRAGNHASVTGVYYRRSRRS